MPKKILIYAILSCTFPTIAIAQDALIMSIDLVRHGDRSSVCAIAGDKNPADQELGILTAEGTQQSIALGKLLRRTYIDEAHLLPRDYQAESVYVRSTDRQRTIDTAQAINAGLYPGAKIPVNTVTTNQDEILVAKPDYHISSLISRYFNQRHTWQIMQRDNQDKFTLWSKWSGMPIENFTQLDCLADNLSYKNKHHLSLPAGFDQQSIAEINKLDESVILQDFQQNKFPNGTRFLQTVQTYFIKTMKHQTELKYVLFVGHDSTLLSVMQSLNKPLEHYPGYNARLNFSLYENNRGYFIKVTYDGKIILEKSVTENLDI